MIKQIADTFLGVTFPDASGGGLPETLRTVRVSEQTGEMFVAAAVTGNSHVAASLAQADGERVITNGGNLFLPLLWVKRAFAALARPLEIVERRVRQAVDEFQADDFAAVDDSVNAKATGRGPHPQPLKHPRKP